MSQLATLAVSVLLEDDQATMVTAATNLESWEFWRRMLDLLWVQQIKKQAQTEQPSEPNDE